MVWESFWQGVACTMASAFVLVVLMFWWDGWRQRVEERRAMDAMNTEALLSRLCRLEERTEWLVDQQCKKANGGRCAAVHR